MIRQLILFLAAYAGVLLLFRMDELLREAGRLHRDPDQIRRTLASFERSEGFAPQYTRRKP